MAGTITLAWATPVKTKSLGARLEAYVESKPFLTTFKLCVKYGRTTGAPVGKLPQELVDMVVYYVHRRILNICGRRWEKYQKCLEDRCYTLDHFTKEQYRENRIYAETGDSEDDREYQLDHFMDLEYELGCRHEDKLREHLEKFRAVTPGSKSSTKRFAKCKEIFKADFELELYFAVLRRYESEYSEFEELRGATILSYMILPSVQSKLNITEGPGVVSYLSSSFIDPSIVQKPTDEQKARFKKALRTLRLRPVVDDLQSPVTFPTSRAGPEKASTDHTNPGAQQTSGDRAEEFDPSGETANISKARVSDADSVEGEPNRKQSSRKNVSGLKSRHKKLKWPKLTMLTSGTATAGPPEDFY